MYTITLQRSSIGKDLHKTKRGSLEKGNNFYVVDGEMMYKKKLIGKNEVCLIGSYNYSTCTHTLYAGAGCKIH